MSKVNYVPAGTHTLTPHLIVKGAAKAIDYYKQVFGATEICRMPTPDGRLMHAAVKIGDSQLFLVDEFPEMGSCAPAGPGGNVVIHMYVPDVDKTFETAVKAGASVRMPPSDMFWGDRYGQLVDPFGHTWSIATHKEDLTPQQMMERSAKAMAEGCCGEKKS